MRTVLVALISAAVLASVSADSQEDVTAGWWIIAGSYANPEGSARNDASIDRASREIKRCGLMPFNDFSFKFRGLATGYDVVVVGPYPERASATRFLGQVQKCIPGAYLKQAEHLGE